MNSAYLGAVGKTGGAFAAQSASISESATASINPAQHLLFPRSDGDTEARRILLALLRDSVPPWPVGVKSGLLRIIRFLRPRRRQSLDEAPRHVGFDHHPAVGGDVADDARDTVQTSNLLAIELLLAVKRDRNSPRVERETRRHHLDEVVDALSRSG